VCTFVHVCVCVCTCMCVRACVVFVCVCVCVSCKIMSEQWRNFEKEEQIEKKKLRK